ncbi:hypothetical protein PV10_08659 [Exophiala mesophila]|uniref:DUF2306 domain-containing protein n=1 Tax=Exophiala mesophila TaxID=212818 RepID=A0A0D1WJL6_EXOME|nr:uncharacterized protein PV10_08659 [Exophiala mesophila]KIV89045.1 hypothetical protein PV10_08659 [Exophiala mesophila]
MSSPTTIHKEPEQGSVHSTSSIKKSSSQTEHQGRFRKLFSWLGFQKNYNVPLFIIFAGAMLGFSLARLEYLDIGGRFRKGSAPGEWYWYRGGIGRIGITLHLAGVLPAGILMIWQFVPAIRRRWIAFHRINGYVVIMLLLLGNVGAFMIMRHAFGGDLSTQAASGFLGIYTTVGMGLAYYNIKVLQVDQHRAWMLRTMIMFGVIITTRIIAIITAQITTVIGSYHVIMNCGELAVMNDFSYLSTNYPQCLANSTIVEGVLNVVKAKFGENVETTGASLRIGFGMALWLSIALHGIGAEVYLALTPREAHRLRMTSYEKQLEAGMANPGSAGLVVEKFGDAQAWIPR